MPTMGDSTGERAVEELRRVLAGEPAVAYALVFGSAARQALRPDSDLDVAVELSGEAPRDPASLGRLAARLESAAGRRVDLVSLEDAAAPLAYRVFRDGRLLIERDRAARVARTVRAILEYLDFKPIEDLCTEGVLRAAVRG